EEGQRVADPFAVAHARHVIYLISGVERGLVELELALNALGEHPATVTLQLVLMSNRADVLEQLGDFDTAGTVLRRALVLAVRAEQRDGPAAAVAVLADTIAIDDESELFDRALWLPDLVRLALAVGDADLAHAAVATAESDAKVQSLPQRVAAARFARAVLD